jgi:hypothetical protein
MQFNQLRHGRRKIGPISTFLPLHVPAFAHIPVIIFIVVLAGIVIRIVVTSAERPFLPHEAKVSHPHSGVIITSYITTFAIAAGCKD